MSTLTIVIIIIAGICLATAIAVFVCGTIEDKRENERIQKYKSLYGTNANDWEPKFNLEHKGFFAFNTPFVPDKKEVFYLENGYDKNANDFVKENIDVIRGRLAEKGMTFIYLPDVKISAEEAMAMINYCNPGEDVDFSEYNESIDLKSNFLLDYMVFPKNRKKIRSCFAWYDDSLILFDGKKLVHIFHYVSFDSTEAKAYPNEILAEIIPEVGRERSLRGGLYSIVERPK